MQYAAGSMQQAVSGFQLNPVALIRHGISDRPFSYPIPPTAYCLPPTARCHCLLPAAYCLLPTAH